MFQDPRVIAEDLGLCYPPGYCTHSADAAAPAAAAACPRRLGGARDHWRQALVAATRASPLTGLVGKLGMLLAKSRFLRERAFFELLDELLPRRPGTVRALEVGCGAGHLLEMLLRAGWTVDGLEWDPVAAANATRRTGLPVRVGSFYSLELPTEYYDLVVLHHVFEHLEDPRRALRRIHELLAPGGSGVIVVPNPQGLGARLFGTAWIGWDVPRHLVLVTGRGLQQAAAEAGFSSLRRRTTSRYAAPFFACSRTWRAGNSIAKVRLVDRLRALGSRTLVVAGWDVGEELVCLLHKH